MLWVLFGILLTLWLIALIVGGIGGLIHSVITMSRSEAQPVPLPPVDGAYWTKSRS
jgi:hypothetical protein